MPLSIKYTILENKLFDYPFRMIISGSSQSGKTTFTEKLLANQHIFQKPVRRIVYCHPDYFSQRPVEWHTVLKIPVVYQAGLPSLNELCELESDTCVVLDDLYEESINSPAIDYLFRVLSGKKRINVIILSQRFYACGRFALNIRNNSNFLVMMRNVDAKLNNRIASMLCLKKPIEQAIKDTFEQNYYPYIFVDSSPRAQVSSIRCYTNIFNHIQIAYHSNGMKAYILSENDFLSQFTVINSTSAIKKESESSDATSDESCSENKRSDINERTKQRARQSRYRRQLRKNLQQY